MHGLQQWPHSTTELAQGDKNSKSTDTAWVAAVAAFPTELGQVDKDGQNTAHRKNPLQWLHLPTELAPTDKNTEHRRCIAAATGLSSCTQ